MYESPIEIIRSEIETRMEGEVLSAVQRVGVNVDKEELLKALQYDREQYEKGYEDGLNADRWIPCSERLPENNTNVLVTTIGGTVATILFEKNDFHSVYSFGSECILAWQPLPKPFVEERKE